MTTQEKVIRDKLARLFWEEGERNLLIEDAGLPLQEIPLNGSSIVVWNKVVNYAAHRGLIAKLINAAARKYPEHFNAGTEIDIVRDIAALDIDLTNEQIERITLGESTLLPISFLHKGLRCSQSVAKIRCRGWAGTGFMLDSGYFITNNHVLPSAEVAKTSVAIFDFEHDAHMKLKQGVEFSFDVESFHTFPDDDITAVKINGYPEAEYGALKLAIEDVTIGSYVNIIQHPLGMEKQIALYHNTVFNFLPSTSNPTRIQYLTDTEPGSSGSPVFNSSWEVVALHNSSSSPLDRKTRKPITVNQGIPVSRLRAILGSPLASGFVAPFTA